MVTSPFVLSFTCCANLCASTARKSPSPSLAPGHWWDRRSVTALAPPPLSASPQALSKPTNKTAPIAHKNRRLSVFIFPSPSFSAAASKPPVLPDHASSCGKHAKVSVAWLRRLRNTLLYFSLGPFPRRLSTDQGMLLA